MQPQIISIPTLSGGVSRQPASRRSEFEAEELDNCLVTLERSIEKRPGFTVLSGIGGYNLSFLPVTANPHFTWFQVDRIRRFLIITDRNATAPAQQMLYILKIDSDEWLNVSPAYQWDPTDAELAVVDNADAASIVDGDDRYPVKVAAAAFGNANTKAVYDQALALGILNRDSREYVLYSVDTNSLKTLQTGLNLLYLNTRVKAGFTSGTSGKTVGLDGVETTTDDVAGAKVTYYTSAGVSKAQDDGRLYYDAAWPSPSLVKDPNLTNKFIPVEDFIYGDFESPWLGQSVAGFNELRFPPDLNDWYANNSDTAGDDSAKDMLRILYDQYTEYPNDIDGQGKIYFCDGPYLEMRAGYYRIVSFPTGLTSTTSGPSIDGAGPPYTQRVRTPDYCSVLDKKRMPQRLTYDGTTWRLQPVEWAHRLNGDRDTNPGPSPFLESGEAVHVEINSLCNFRDRIFFSARDVVFSSRLGELENLWLDDPSNITYADPIDLRAASNTYAEITAMLPFNNYLFINSRGNVQFELKGDSNNISPLTAEISSTTFYSTAEGIDPVTLGSQIYFYAPQRLYIYFNADSRDFNTAVEVSSTVPGYLPRNIGATCVGTAQNYLIAVDNDSKNDIYIYGNRFSGDQVVQSAFWRYVLPESEEVFSINAWDNYLYCVTKTSQGGSTWRIMRNLLEDEDINVPRLDGMIDFTLTAAEVNPVNQTITVPYTLPSGTAYLWLDGQIIELENRSDLGNATAFTYSGLDLQDYYEQTAYVGVGFTMLARLSTILLRNNGTVIEGVLNLKTMTTRHHNTGSYRVEVTRLNRPNKLISEFSATNTTTDETIDVDGVFVSKIFGVAEDTVIDIVNDTPAPCNITQLEFRSIFNRKNSSKR